MTIFYQTQSWNSQPQVTQETIELWKHLSEKSKWRIVQLANGFYQTEHQDVKEKDTWHDVTRRETIEGAEKTIDSTASANLTRCSLPIAFRGKFGTITGSSR